jgi:hypothetical protein
VKFDERLQDLFKLRLKVNTAVTQEELKMARIKLWILTSLQKLIPGPSIKIIFLVLTVNMIKVYT